jgi:phospholipid-binding lipoprotein MlaA
MLAGWAVALLLSGCATSAGTGAERNPQDPYEALNRKTFALNDRLDRRVVKPVALAYEKTLPSVVREAVANFFGNIGDAWSAVNWLLQGEVQRGIEQGARVAWNSTLGLAG